MATTGTTTVVFSKQSPKRPLKLPTNGNGNCLAYLLAQVTLLTSSVWERLDQVEPKVFEDGKFSILGMRYLMKTLVIAGLTQPEYCNGTFFPPSVWENIQAYLTSVEGGRKAWYEEIGRPGAELDHNTTTVILYFWARWFHLKFDFKVQGLDKQEISSPAWRCEDTKFPLVTIDLKHQNSVNGHFTGCIDVDETRLEEFRHIVWLPFHPNGKLKDDFIVNVDWYPRHLYQLYMIRKGAGRL